MLKQARAPRSSASRGRRWLAGKLFVAAGVLGLLLHFAAREAVAAAVAYAPNALREPGRFPLPAELDALGAVRLHTHVASPEATIESWVVEPQRAPAKGTLVLLHGVRMDKRSLASIGSFFADAGYRAVLVDLRGHGESSGEYLTYGAVESGDISAVLDDLAKRVSLGCVGTYGFSYGGAVAIELGANDPRVVATVAVSPFASLREVVGDYRRKYLPEPLSLVPNAWFQSAVDEGARIAAFDPDASSPLSAAARSRAKLLLIHGQDDSQVPLRHSELLLHVNSRARLVTIPHANHEAMPADPSGVIRREASAWFERWFSEVPCDG